MGRVVTADELQTHLASLRSKAGSPPHYPKVVTTNGCFDILHVGHLRYLQAAKAMGDLLVVAVNSDRSVKTLNKGPDRPVVGEADRAELLAGLACVDYAVIFDEHTPESLLRLIKPDIHVKGGDYNPNSLPEAATLKELGTELRFVPMIAGRSTTSLLNKINHPAC